MPSPKLIRGLVLAVALFLLPAVVPVPVLAIDADLQLFSSDKEAQKHCPADTVVWLNLPSGVYHFRGQRWYGATKNGAYACRREADKAGDRPTRNGQ